MNSISSSFERWPLIEVEKDFNRKIQKAGEKERLANPQFGKIHKCIDSRSSVNLKQYIHVSLLPQELPGWSESDTCTWRERRDQRERQTPPEWKVAGNKQGSLQRRLVLGATRWSRSPHLLAKTLKVYMEALKGCRSHTQSRWSQQHITLSRLYSWNWHLLWKWWAKGTFQRQWWGEEPLIRWSCPLHDLLRQYAKKLILRYIIINC